MIKIRYFDDYVNHMLRFYVRCGRTEFKTEVDERNWEVIDKILGGLKAEDKNVIIKIYEKQDSIPNNILETSKELGIRQNVIWTLLNKVCRKIAKERELI